MSWRKYTDWAKHRPLTLKVADRLGRGRGRLRWFDSLNRPVRPPHKPDLSRWHEAELAAAWIGHATVLLRLGGMTILTDPVFSSRVGIGLGLVTGGPRRKVGPALEISELPPLDLILISHAHFDHLDRPSLTRLRAPAVVTAANTADLIEDLGFRRIAELEWGKSVRLGELTVTALAVKHWGARTFIDHHRGFNAYLLEAGGKRVLYGGDTAFQENFRGLGKIDLAIMGIGAYNPWIHNHATPEQAWEMAGHVEAEYILPIHHSTFRLSQEPMEEPIARMLTAAGHQANRIVVRSIGEVWTHDSGHQGQP